MMMLFHRERRASNTTKGDRLFYNLWITLSQLFIKMMRFYDSRKAHKSSIPLLFLQYF